MRPGTMTRMTRGSTTCRVRDIQAIIEGGDKVKLDYESGGSSMKLWLLTQNVCSGYDTYDSAVVVAEHPDAARRIHPQALYLDKVEHLNASILTEGGSWPNDPDLVSVTYLGEADKAFTKEEVLCASFNAG